jgi:hypothetical protein
LTETSQPRGLLPPFPDISIIESTLIAPAIDSPPMALNRDNLDAPMTGKDFIASLAAKYEAQTPSILQPPIMPGTSCAAIPHGLNYPPAQQLHSFQLAVSLLPQTFSVQLLSNLHMRLQHVASALEWLDTCFTREVTKATSAHSPSSTLWETWMSPSGAAEMVRALQDVRKGLDELSGATTRAGWIVDTWSSYQNRKLDGTNSLEASLGSAAIDGIEIGIEIPSNVAAQAPIARPSLVKSQKPIEMSRMNSAGSKDKQIVEKVAFPISRSAIGSFRPPPGLALPLIESSVAEESLGNPSQCESLKGMPPNSKISTGPSVFGVSLHTTNITAPDFPQNEHLEFLQRHFAEAIIGEAKLQRE